MTKVNSLVFKLRVHLCRSFLFRLSSVTFKDFYYSNEVLYTMHKPLLASSVSKSPTWECFKMRLTMQSPNPHSLKTAMKLVTSTPYMPATEITSITLRRALNMRSKNSVREGSILFLPFYLRKYLVIMTMSRYQQLIQAQLTPIVLQTIWLVLFPILPNHFIHLLHHFLY